MTWPFVAALHDHDELASTSDLARQMVQDPAATLPFAVRARRQTRGRGRGQNAWWSDDGSLCVTLALDPAALGLTTSHEPRLALALAVATVDALEGLHALTPPLGVRWPNDVEAGDKKLAGVLPERVETPDGVRILIGVGINVLTRLDQAPAEVRAMTGSVAGLIAEGRPTPGLDEVLHALLTNLETVIPRLAHDDPTLAARWTALDTLRGHSVRIDLGTSVLTGVGAGIDPDGALLVATDRGLVRVFGGQVLRNVPGLTRD